MPHRETLAEIQGPDLVPSPDHAHWTLEVP